MRLTRAPLIAAVAIAVTLAGCSSGDSAPDAGATEGSTTSSDSGQTPAPSSVDESDAPTPSGSQAPTSSSGDESTERNSGDTSPDDSGGANQPGAASTTGTVQITLKVTGCVGCTFTAFTTDRGTTRQLGARTVSGGVARFTMTPAQTSGLAFTVTNPQGDGVANARAAMVWQYDGLTVGAKITDAAATRSQRATWCWSGTSASKTTVPVTVVRFSEPGPGGPWSLRVYANPMASGQAPFVETTRGALGVQDDPICPG